jgi:hypothetical protein
MRSFRRSFDSCAGAPDCDVARDEISDRALELAAGLVRDGTASMTIAFCSGLDECSHPRPRRRVAE